MIISFENEELRDICLKKEVALKKLGLEDAEKLQNRYADLRAVENFQEEPINHYIRKKAKGKYSISLGKFELLLIPINKPLRYDKKGEIDKEFVTRLKVIDIHKPHA